MIYPSAKNNERDADVAPFYGIDSNGDGKDDWGISLHAKANAKTTKKAGVWDRVVGCKY